MKTKILLTSALALAISVPAMAADPTPTQTTVTSTSSCTETTLGTATGPVDIEADWQANTINLTWDANNGTVSGGPEQCIYDGTFTLPTSITRTGYEFAGWKVKPSAFDLSTLDASINGTAYGYQGDSTGYYGADSSNTDKYGITEDQTWVAEFSYGTIKGMAKCSAKSGNNHYYAWDGNSSDWTASESELTSASGEKQYCWCQATGFDAEKDGTYMSVSSSSWVFSDDRGIADSCAFNCAYYCADYVRNRSDFRPAVFGLSAN